MAKPAILNRDCSISIVLDVSRFAMLPPGGFTAAASSDIFCCIRGASAEKRRDQLQVRDEALTTTAEGTAGELASGKA